MMMNELILFFQIGIISLFLIIALRLGKEALVTFTVLQMVLANLFVLKQTTLFGLQATSADALAVGSFLGFNLLQEFFSRQLAKKTIAITFVFLIFYALMSRVHLLYMPSGIDTTHEHFVSLLSVVPWLVIGSMVVYVMAQCLDYILYGVLKRIWADRLLIVRNYIALGLSHLADTILFTCVLAYLGVITNIAHVVAVSFAVKFGIILIATPFVAVFAQRYKPGR